MTWLSLLSSFFRHQVVLIHLDYLGEHRVNTGIEPMSEDHGSDLESSMFTTRPGSFPKFQFICLCCILQLGKDTG
jgi:hypothetical protein